MKKKKILVVDDEPDFLAVISYRLESDNYTVVTAENGRIALQKIKKDKPDVVLLDIMMPEMDGLKVLRSIRRTNPRLPVFMITSFSNEDRLKLANKLNASGFIMKTGDLKKEINTINNALRIVDRFKPLPRKSR
jgi:CheY-like chemotaxis protein